MKSLVFFTLCILFASGMMATHITGGEISYDYLGNNQYNIRLKVYRDCGPNNTLGTGFDDPLYIGIYFGNGALFYVEQISFVNAVVTILPFGVDNPCLVVPDDVCIEEAIYQVTVTLAANAEGYDLIYQRCCRSPIIINLEVPQDQGMTCSTHIPGTNELTGDNSSASFINLPPALMCTGELFQMDHSAFDADGDELYYYFCQPFLGAGPLDPAPATPLGPPFTEVTWADGFSSDYPIESDPEFTIDPTTGFLSGQPTDIGNYVFSICVDELRNGQVINTVKRDYMIQVVQCGQTILAAVAQQLDPCVGYTLQFQNNSSGIATEFFWDFGVVDVATDTTSLENPEFTFPEYGTYTVTLIAQPESSCTDTVTTVVQINPENPIVMGYELVVPLPCDTSRVFTFQFTGENADDVTWDFGDGQSTQGEEALHQYDENGDYNVLVTAYNALCETTITQSIPVSTNSSIYGLNLIMPNVFTPNQDNKNQLLRPFDPLEETILPADSSIFSFFDEYDMKVYNRWGNLVFDSNGSAQGWDGRTESSAVKGDTYYYIIKCSLKCDSRQYEYAGYVTLLEEK